MKQITSTKFMRHPLRKSKQHFGKCSNDWAIKKGNQEG